jgi:predicted nucleic acid-binding protein
MQAAARQALHDLTAAGVALLVAPQNLIEFWAVATRPLAANGLDLTPAQAATEIGNFKAAFRLLPDSAAIFTEWERLAATYAVRGKQAHDTRLVAVMKAHGVGRILTFNAGDFSRFAGEGVSTVSPAAGTVPPP